MIFTEFRQLFFCLSSVRFSKEQEKPGFMAESANGFLTSHIFSEMGPTEIEEQEHPATKLWGWDSGCGCPCVLGKLRVPAAPPPLSFPLPPPPLQTHKPSLQSPSAQVSPPLGGLRLYYICSEPAAPPGVIMKGGRGITNTVRAESCSQERTKCGCGQEKVWVFLPDIPLMHTWLTHRKFHGSNTQENQPNSLFPQSQTAVGTQKGPWGRSQHTATLSAWPHFNARDVFVF